MSERTNRRGGFRWLACIVLCCWCLLACNAPAPPSNRVMIDHFQRHATDYERLRDMLHADPGIGTLGRTFARGPQKFTSASPEQLGVTAERLTEYRRLMDKVETTQIDRIGSEMVAFAYWFDGKLHRKRIDWFARPPKPRPGVRASLIREQWYIVQD